MIHDVRTKITSILTTNFPLYTVRERQYYGQDVTFPSIIYSVVISSQIDKKTQNGVCEYFIYFDAETTNTDEMGQILVQVKNLFDGKIYVENTTTFSQFLETYSLEREGERWVGKIRMNLLVREK